MVFLQDEPCTQYTLPKKDISHIAIILTDEEVQQDEVSPIPEITPRRAVLTEKSAVISCRSVIVIEFSFEMFVGRANYYGWIISRISKRTDASAQ